MATKDGSEVQGLGQPRQHDALGVTFDQQNETREVQLRKGQEGIADELDRLDVAGGHRDGLDGRRSAGRIASAITHFLGRDAPEHRGRMAADEGLPSTSLHEIADLLQDP